MEKPLGIANNPSFLNNISLLDLPQKEIVILAKKVFNGSSRDLTFRVETNLEKCRLLWNEFSPNESLFDLWDFRLAFWRGYQYQPYFITLSFQEKLFLFYLYGLIKKIINILGLAVVGMMKIFFYQEP